MAESSLYGLIYLMNKNIHIKTVHFGVSILYLADFLMFVTATQQKCLTAVIFLSVQPHQNDLT